MPNPSSMPGGAAAADEHRPKLLAIAYRMLGSVADAEDAVQDAYVRFQQAGGVENAEAWLVKATTRLCIDRLRRAKRRQESAGPWLPEPVSGAAFGEASAQFDEKGLVDLTWAVAAINAWNRMAIGFRAVPGTYRPGMYAAQPT